MGNGFLDGVGLPKQAPKRSHLEEALESPEMEDDDVLDIDKIDKSGGIRLPWTPIPEDDPFDQWEYIDLD